MAEAYALPTSSMGKIRRWYDQKIASGQTVQPWELESAYTGEMNALMGRQAANRSLSLQKEQFGVTSAAQAARDAEVARMNTVNTRLAEQQIGAGKEASYANLAGTGLTTAGLYYALKKPAVPGAPGGISKGYDVAKEGIGNAYNAAKNYFNPQPAPTETIPVNLTGEGITAPTTVEPAMFGMEGAPPTTTGTQVGQGLTFSAEEASAGTAASMNAMAAGLNAAAPGAITPIGGGIGITGAGAAVNLPTATTTTAAPAAGTSWLGPAALATVGLRAIGKNQTNDLAALRTPITGVGELGTKYLGDTTGIKEISEVGRWLPRLEEKAWTGIETGIGKVVDVVSNIVKGTWLCTEVARYIGLTDDDNKDLQKLRRYCIKNHRDWIKEYLDKGKRLIEAINEAIGAKGDRMIFYADLKRDMVYPVLELVRQGKEEEAFIKYRDVSFDLFDKYTPGLITLKR